VKIDIGEVVDKLKDINNPNFRLTKSNDTSINDLINNRAAPFIGFLYLVSIITGSLLGRLIRISRLDTKFKLLRFKNYWFYLLNGQHSGFKKLKHLKERNKKHIFTNADILIDSNSKTHLYSGIVVDYELQENDCHALSKIMLQNAKRYSLRGGNMVPVEVPGTILIVDCVTMKNLNLTYIYEETKTILNSKIPNNLELIFSLFIILIIPFFMFQAESLDFDFYSSYFELKWYLKVLVYLIVTQLPSLLIPFVKRDDKYMFVTRNIFLGKFFWLIILAMAFWILN
jgi:hypothetical protein